MYVFIYLGSPILDVLLIMLFMLCKYHALYSIGQQWSETNNVDSYIAISRVILRRQ